MAYKGMFWMGKRGAALVALAIFVILAGCGPKADGGPRELKLGYVMAPVGAAHEAAERFAALVEEKTAGEVTVKLYPSGQLGGDRELAEGLGFGSVDLVLSGLASIAAYVPQYEALETPFVFRDYEHMDKALEGPIGEEVEQALLEAKDIRILDWWYRGPRFLTTNKAVHEPADLEGMKLRVPEMPTYIAAWKILGANTTPIDYSEMFMALQQGIVEGQENPLEVIYTAGLYEVQDYVIETRHMLSAYMLMASTATLESLPPEHRQAVEEAAEEAGSYEFELMRKFEEEYVEKLKAEGMEFIEVDPEVFRSKVLAELPRKFEDQWAPGFFERIQEIQ